MIPVRRTPAFEKWFHGYVTWLARRSFRGIWIDTYASFPRGGFIAAPNHTSWWDGFVPLLVQRSVAPQTPFALMMSESELRKFPFFRRLGAFSVDARSARAAFGSIIYAGILALGGDGVWIFPQGRIAAAGLPLSFSAGFVHAARRANVPIIPVAIRYAMLEAREPDAFVSIGRDIDPYSRTACEETAAAVRVLLSGLDYDIATGIATNRRYSVISPRAGIDDVVAAVTGKWRRAL